MLKTQFTSIAGTPQKTLEEWALIGLQRGVRKSIALGRTNEETPVPSALPEGVNETYVRTRALWGILGSDDKNDRYVGHCGPVGISLLMTWGMRDGRVEEIKSFLPWALGATHLADRELVLCEALTHPETLPVLKPLLPEIFREMVYPSYCIDSQVQSSTGFISPVHFASRHKELHEEIDRFMPAALERELAWAPQNFALLLLARYPDADIPKVYHPLISRMAEKALENPAVICNTACARLVDLVHNQGSKDLQRILHAYAAKVFPDESISGYFRHPRFLILQARPEGGVLMHWNRRDDALSQILCDEEGVSPLYWGNAIDASTPVEAALELLKDMEERPFRSVLVAAREAGKTLRRVVNGDESLFRRMSAEYQARYAQKGVLPGQQPA